jgi:hypothetical protein
MVSERDFKIVGYTYNETSIKQPKHKPKEG